MGNDGGSIPKRHELVKNAARNPTVSELKATILESQGHAWSHCALSGAPFDTDNVVSDWRGRLYNYEALLRGLMPSDDPPEVTPTSLGVKSLRDVVKLKFSKSSDAWVCPISMKKLGPATKTVYLVPCGHVFAEVAMTEIQENVCPECSIEVEDENIIALLPTTEKEVSRLEQRIEGLRDKGLTHALKKDKSDKKKKRKGQDVEEEEGKTMGNKKIVNAKKSIQKEERESRLSGINNPMAASLTAQVLAEQDERIKRRKIAGEGVKAR